MQPCLISGVERAPAQRRRDARTYSHEGQETLDKALKLMTRPSSVQW